MRLTGPRQTVKLAKRLRQEMTLPEIVLWNALKQMPIRFRRQHPAGPYVLDFYCATVKLAIEVDSEAHERGDRPERDARRDEWCAGQGIQTLRLRATDVLRDLDAVVRHIDATVAARRPPPSA